MTVAIDAAKIAVLCRGPGRRFRRIAGEVTAEPRKFGLFRNSLKTRVHPAGTTIFQEGEHGKSMFAIKRGRVAIMAVLRGLAGQLARS